MDEQQVSVVLLAINKVKEDVDDMRKSVDDLRMNLKEMRKAINTTTALLKHFGNSKNKILTEAGDVISSNAASNTSKVIVENVSAASDTSVGRVFPILQPMVTVYPYEYSSYLLDIKVAVVDWNGETSCEWKFGVVKNVLKSCLTPVCENDSVNVLSLFVSKMASGSWCCIQPLVIAVKPPPKPPDASLNMLGQMNQVLSIASKISCKMFKSIRFPGSSKKDDASTKCLVLVSWFISVYIIELSGFHLALTECVKSGVSALLDVVALVGSIDEYGIHNTVGLKNGDNDEISCYFRHRGNNQWLFAIVVRSESKLLCSVKLERATGNTLWFSRLQTNAIFNELCKMFYLREPSFVPQKEKGSFVMFVSLQGSGKIDTWTRYSYYHQKIRWKTDLVFAAIQIVFSGCLHYVILSVADCLNFSGLNLVLFMLTNGSTEAALLISYCAATMTGIVNFIEASMERCSCVLLIRNYIYFELQIFGHDQRFFWIHRWSLVVGDAWLCKLNCKSRHIFYHYTIGNLQGLSSMVLLMGEPSELMCQGFFNANVISTLIGVVSKFSTYWLFQKACVCKLKIVAVLYSFSELKDEAMIIIKGRVDDRFLLSLTGVHCESLWYGCRPEQYHIFSKGFGLFEKYKTLFMPLDEADKNFHNQAHVLCTSPTGQQPTQGAVYDYYSQLNPSRQLQTRMSTQFRMYSACTPKNFKPGLPLYDTERYTSLENQATQHIIGAINQQPLLHTTGKDFDLKKFLAVSLTYNFNINIMKFPPGAFLNTKVSYDQPGLFFEEGIGILVSIEISPFSHISSHVANTKPPTEVHGSATSSKLQAATRYTYLETKRHNLAVYRLLGTDMELCNKGSGFVAPPGVTNYEELCAIVSLDWTNVKNEMITNSKFKNFLELVIEFKELINDFYSSHYTLCLEHPSNNKSNLVLDMWMLATAFGTTIIGLKKDFKASITDSQSHARIDTNNKIAFKRNLAWIILACTLNWNLEFLMFSLPRPPEVNDLEDKVVFEGRRM